MRAVTVAAEQNPSETITAYIRAVPASNQRNQRCDPLLLLEGWTVFVNSLRQVRYSHVKTGTICFQIPENPEFLNDLVFKEVLAELIASAKTAGNQSRTVRIRISTTNIIAVCNTKRT